MNPQIAAPRVIGPDSWAVLSEDRSEAEGLRTTTFAMAVNGSTVLRVLTRQSGGALAEAVVLVPGQLLQGPKTSPWRLMTETHGDDGAITTTSALTVSGGAVLRVASRTLSALSESLTYLVGVRLRDCADGGGRLIQ